MSTRLNPSKKHAVQRRQAARPQMVKSHKKSIRTTTLSIPLAITQKSKTKAPQFRALPSQDGRVRIAHEEYAQDLTATAAGFGIVATIPLNPGNSQMGPWVSQIAPNWESYHVELLEIKYKPLVPATVAGGVFMAVDYDAQDTAPTSKAEFMSFHEAQRCSIWEEQVLKCDKKDLNKLPQRFVLNQVPVSGADARLSNIGTLFVAVDGVPSANLNVPFGELYFKYVFTLITPQQGHEESGSILLPTANVASTPFNNQAGIATVGKIINAVAPNILTFTEPGRKLVDLATTFTSGVTGVAPTLVSSVTGGIADAIISGATGGQQFTAGLKGVSEFLVNVTKVPAQVTVDFSPSGTGPIGPTTAKVSGFPIGSPA